MKVLSSEGKGRIRGVTKNKTRTRTLAAWVVRKDQMERDKKYPGKHGNDAGFGKRRSEAANKNLRRVGSDAVDLGLEGCLLSPGDFWTARYMRSQRWRGGSGMLRIETTVKSR